MEYGYPERRKSKNDKRAKQKYNRYKRGGGQRSVHIESSDNYSKRHK